MVDLSFQKLFLLRCAFLRRSFLGATTSTTCARFRALRPVLGATAPTSIDAKTVERAAHNVIAHTRQVFHSSAAYEHNRVLLQVMPFARNVSDHFLAVRRPHLRHFP